MRPRRSAPDTGSSGQNPGWRMPTDLQEEMLGRVQEGEWAVLVMDPQSTRIMSAACRISEILNYGVAREPMLFALQQQSAE
jgi:hypothetical protein